MLHKVELRPEIIKEVGHITGLQAPSLDEDGLLDTQVMTSSKVSEESLRIRNRLIIEDLKSILIVDRSSRQNFYKAIKDSGCILHVREYTFFANAYETLIKNDCGNYPSYVVWLSMVSVTHNPVHPQGNDPPLDILSEGQ